MSGDKEPGEETPHITTVKRQWRLRQQAAQKPHFKVVDGKLVPYTVSPPADDLATTVAAAQEEESQRNPQIGQMIRGRGIFFGTWEPKDRQGKSLGKIFNLFAAPEDLTDDSGNKEVYTYIDAVKRIGALKNWHGHDGTNYATDKELYTALKDGSYDGGWILPPGELLAGMEADRSSGVRKGIVVQPDNLFELQNKGALKGTFKTTSSGGLDFSDCYNSCTENGADPSYVWMVHFSDGYEDWLPKDNCRLSCRPVRLEPRS